MGNHVGRWIGQIVVGLWLACASVPAGAISKVDPGETPKLKPHEGLLVVAIDSDSELRSAYLDKEGGRSVAMIRAITPGRMMRLYKLPAGRYRWSRVVPLHTYGLSGSFMLEDSPEFGFEVKSGQLNYAGDLVYQTTGFLRASLRLSNRSLPVLDWLETHHPQMVARHAFAYTGYYPDPFPGFYASERVGKQVNAELDKGRSVPLADSLPLPPRELWKPGVIGDVSLSPDGRFVAMVVPHEREENQWWVNLIDIATGKSQRIVHSVSPVSEITWESESTLLVTWQGLLRSGLTALHVRELQADGTRRIERVDGPRGGRLVDLLPDESGIVLFESRNTDDQLVVHRLDLRSDKGVRSYASAGYKRRLNVGVRDDLTWFADGNGDLRAAFVRKGEEDVVLIHGRYGVYREVFVYDPDGFQPIKLSYDGNRIFGFTDQGRGQRDLVEFDPATNTIVRTVHSRPGTDLVSAVFDDRRRPIGAIYYEDGRRVTEYFEESDRHFEELLRQAFPGRAISPVQRSRDGQRVLLWVDGSDSPPKMYLQDRGTRTAELLGEFKPHLAGRRFAPAKVLAAKGSDGLPVQAFLTLPEASGKRPLVVMPHGGPIGVSDTLHFNPDVQFLASLGYAVLQVNFRGSEGYGKAFREAGRRNYGKLIEDDIDAAIRAAIAAYPLDESRMCVLGSSYGGYSAMVSTIRWPGRFRCAVSMAGISDLALFFSASDSGRDADVRAKMEKIIGNPAVPADLAEMQAYSPLYRYGDLTVPLMLVHGLEDARVDFEHSRRLMRVLALDGRPPVLLTFEDEGHGLDELDNLDKAWSTIATFLAQHLGASGAPTPPEKGDAAPVVSAAAANAP